MKRLSVIIICFLCSVCASCLGVHLDPVNLSSLDSVNFEFVDLRPEKEKVWRPSKYGDEPPCHFYGDKQFDPDRILALKGALINHLKQKLVGQKIEINSFEFSACVPGRTKRHSWGGGLLVSLMISTKDDRFNCSLKATVNGQLISIADSEPMTGALDTPAGKKDAKRLMQRIFDKFVHQVEITLEKMSKKANL